MDLRAFYIGWWSWQALQKKQKIFCQKGKNIFSTDNIWTLVLRFHSLLLWSRCESLDATHFCIVLAAASGLQHHAWQWPNYRHMRLRLHSRCWQQPMDRHVAHWLSAGIRSTPCSRHLCGNISDQGEIRKYTRSYILQSECAHGSRFWSAANCSL